MGNLVEISLSEIESILRAKLLAHDFTEADAKTIFEHLLYAEKSGKNTHGFLRLPALFEFLDNNHCADYTLSNETPVSAMIDCGGRPGYLSGDYAVDLCIEKLSNFGVAAIAGCRSHSLGMLGYHLHKLALRGYVGLLASTSIAKVAPYGSIEAFMGTNPLAIAVPTDDEPVVYDAATSKIAVGDVISAIETKSSLGEGVLLDESGKSTCNPNDLKHGALLPVGGRKGSGLSIMIEFLAGLLVGAPGSKHGEFGEFGFLMIGIDPEIFVGRESFIERVVSMCETFHKLTPDDLTRTVLLPGESASRMRKENADLGAVQLPDTVVTVLRNAV
ncbi:MAG: Ldh family oxidoreductase [Verrucomicrobiales bacterium]